MPLIYDSYRILKVLTFKRIGNYLLIVWSYYLSRITKKIIHKGNPAFISVEPTTRCNLHCAQCFITDKAFSRPKGNLKVETFEKILHEASPTAFYLNLYFQGEPFMNDDLNQYILLAKQSRFYVAISTNAHYLSQNTCHKLIASGLDKIIVSVDGADAETYKKYRKGGNYDKVIEGIKTLVAAKKKFMSQHPVIELQFLRHRQNERQLKRIKALAKTLLVDKLTIKSFQLLNPALANEWLPRKKSRYKIDKDGNAIINSRLPNRCFRMWNSCVFTWDGDVVPCCFDKNADHSMGNIHKENLTEIWKSPAYNDFRKKVFSQRKNISICGNCSEGL